MAYIGLISDTHCLFDDKLRKFLEPVDTIWHAGDFGNLETAEAIAAFKPLTGVYGNCDGYDIRAIHPITQAIETGGLKILMTHIGGYPGHYDNRALQMIYSYRPDVFICGHSHILRVMNDKNLGMMVLNPGAAGKFGFHQVRTALRFHIEEGKLCDMEVWEWPKD